MAFYTIEKRTTSTGEQRYRCTVAVRMNGTYAYRQNKTFKKMGLAKAWGVQRVADIDSNGIPLPPTSDKVVTFGALIDKYVEHPHIKFGRSKRDSLRLIRRCEISDLTISQLTQKSFIDHCEYRAACGAGPSTRWQDISFIGAVLKAAKPLFDIDVDIQDFMNARYIMVKSGMISPGGIRSRRPTRDECALLIEALKQKQETSYLSIPYSEIFMFSILTCMRVGEVTRLRWEDLDEKQRAIMVRDRKDPRKKIGNHMTVALLGEAWHIVQRQPRQGDLIFPYKSKTISQAYRQERDRLNIVDLRYHDLRREGVSRLFEAGFSIEEVAQVSGHRSLKLLWKVYTELFPSSLHDKFDSFKVKNIEP
ncbi:site-specific integrase [Erwinia pyri]|uniref:Site-specific integrase n=1 Tax=Erwinia pyri TaxID=3062598 RepID=A0AA50DFG7_9GAMM|nr:site-specific integrase [Erwinia sp. DE2]WLS77194.1 site-specific integrase [Erwinia sp. DE2]